MGGVKRILQASLVIGVSALPMYAFAAGIVPCGNTDPAECNWDAAIRFANNLLTYLIGLGVLIAAIIIAWAGIQILLAQGNPGKISAAKGMMWNVVVGLTVMILAFTIIKVILTTLGVDRSFRADGL